MNVKNMYLPTLAGKCAKAHVVATLVTQTGEHYESSNFCLTPQERCPRDLFGYKSGEGYQLCKTICNQAGHAEENVIFFAKRKGADVKGATIYVDYTWICENCKKTVSDVDAIVVIGKAPFPKDSGSKIRNQCDGCCSGAEIKGRLHVDRHGKAFMTCERGKYESI